MLHLKTLTNAIRKSNGAPSAEHLALINNYTLRDHAVEEMYTREFVLAHNGIDRDGEVIDEALLEDFVKSLPGKGLFTRHPGSWDGDSGPGDGRWYAARTERMTHDQAKAILREPNLRFPPDRTEATLLFANAYVPRIDSTNQLIAKMDAGVASDVSMGFNAKGRADVMGADGNRVAVRLLGPGEGLEASIVWLGAQPGARALKAFSPNGESDVDQKEFDALKAKLGVKDAEIAALQKQLAVHTEIATALGDTHKALLEQPTELVKLALAGQAYRTSLVATIVAGERLKGLVGDKPEDLVAASKLYASADTAVLEARAKACVVPVKPGIAGSDPNAQQGVQKVAAGSPLGNPLITGAGAA